MSERLETVWTQYNKPKLDKSILWKNIDTFKDKVSTILWWFKTVEEDWVTKKHTHRKNKNQKFYSHIVQDLYFQDLETLPNDRKNYIYKYLKRFLVPIIKQWTLWIYNGRVDKTKVDIDEFGIEENGLINDNIHQNKAYVQEYIDENTWELNGKFKDKLDEYYWIYETVLVKRIQYELHEKLEHLEEATIRNMLINIANEFTFILKAFSDKLTVGEFEKIFLKNDSVWVVNTCKSISAIYDDFQYTRRPIETLVDLNEEQEIRLTKKQREQRERLQKEIEEKQRIENEEEKRHNDLLEMYKSFVPTALNVDEDYIYFDHTKLAQNIEQHFKDSFLDIADMFKHWLYSEDMSIENLEKIRIILFRYYDNIKTLKRNDKAFPNMQIRDYLNSLLSKKRTDDIQVKDILSQDYEFKSFERLCFLMDGVEQYRWISMDERKRLYKQERYSRLYLLCEEIKWQKIEQNKHIEFLDISETQLENLDFDEFNQAGPINRKKYFLDNVYIRDKQRNIIGHNFDPILDENGKETEDLLNFAIYYSDTHKSYRTQEDNVISDLKKIFMQLESWQKINTYDFQENNIYYEQLLVSWFRYNLALKKYRGTNIDISKILNEEMFGPKELLLSRFDQEISTSNISFRNGGSENKIHNTSIWNIDQLIEKYELRFKKRPINLNDEKHFGIQNYTEVWVKNLLMKDISRLYLPNKEGSEHLEYEEIKEYLDGIEQYSIYLLQRRDVSDERFDQYREIFKDYKISEDDFDQIVKVRKFLRYAQYILPIAHDLSKKSMEEQEAIDELYQLVGSDMIDEETYKFEVWEPKDLKRIFEKIIWSYSWDIREMWDLARMRYIWNSMDDCYEKMNTMIKSIKNNPKLNDYIVQGIVEDSVWNNSERGPKKTQYRDLKLQFKNKKWILIEVQFIVKEMFEWKEEWLTEEELSEIMIHQNLDLWQEFIDELERRADAEWIKIPYFLMSVFDSDVKINKSKLQKYDKKINSDLLYKLHRWSSDKRFKKVMAHIESVVYDRQRWKVIAKQSRKLDNNEELSA